MSEEELKPCPFCGGKAQISEHDDDIYSLKPKYTYSVICKECLLSTNIEYEKIYAIEKWNRRS